MRFSCQTEDGVAGGAGTGPGEETGAVVEKGQVTLLPVVSSLVDDDADDPPSVTGPAPPSTRGAAGTGGAYEGKQTHADLEHGGKSAAQANGHALTLSFAGEGARQGGQPTWTGESEGGGEGAGAGEAACKAAEGMGLQRGSSEGRRGLAGSKGSSEPAARPHTGGGAAESGGWGALLLGGVRARRLSAEADAAASASAAVEEMEGGPGNGVASPAGLEGGWGSVDGRLTGAAGAAGGARGMAADLAAVNEGGASGEGGGAREVGPAVVEILKERYVTLYLAFNEVRRWKGMVRIFSSPALLLSPSPRLAALALPPSCRSRASGSASFSLSATEIPTPWSRSRGWG